MVKTGINNNKSHHKKGSNHPKAQRNNNVAKKQISIDLKAHSIQQLYSMAEQFYGEAKDQNKNDKWNQFITQKGTKKDKITFVAAEILKRPQASLEQFQLLARWSLDQNHNFALPACQALSNIYTEHIFTQKPSLKVFLDSVQDYIRNNKKNTQVLRGDLVGFYLQHHMKHFYGELIRGITEILSSSITHVKKTSIQILANLSKYKELRRMILTTLINKFGDQDMQVVNEVSKSLKNQFYQDVQASETLLQQAQSFLFRQNLSQKSQFYVINFLNNINLKFFSEKSLTKQFDLFFHFFTKLMDKDTQQKSISSRLFLNSIKGLNKIFAFMKSGNKKTKDAIEEKVQIVYKTFHKTTNTKAKVQLLLFLFQSCTHIKGTISDRFYRILYEFLGTNQIIHCSVVQMFFDLLMISLKQDQNLNRNLAFIKRLLQLCFEAQSNFIVTCLILIGKIMQQKQSLQIMMKQKQNILAEDQEDPKAENQTEDRSLPYDMNKRQPIYSGAQKTNLWELTVFKNHYHPTVRKFTEHILNNQQIPYTGNNPLLELSLTSFVEKLSMRKQKKSDGWKLKVKRNLSKIRTSKYESILDKPIESFQQNQQYIKKYLQKRQKIHKNKKSMRAEDIEDFADGIIQKELDKLNPLDDDLDDLSISQEDISGEIEVDQGEQFQDQIQPGSENQEGQDDFQENQFGSDQELGDENQEVDFDQNDGNMGDSQDLDMIDQDDQFDEDEEQGDKDSKEFEDVFDQINDSEQYPTKKKSINKFNKKGNQKNPKKLKKSVKPFKKNKPWKKGKGK